MQSVAVLHAVAPGAAVAPCRARGPPRSGAVLPAVARPGLAAATKRSVSLRASSRRQSPAPSPTPVAGFGAPVVADPRRSQTKIAADAAAAPAPVDDSGKIDGGQATVNVIKSIMGAGAFALPWAYAQAGHMLSNSIMVVACVVSLYTLNMMVRAKNAILRDEPNCKADLSSYSGLAGKAIGPLGARFSEVSVLSCVLGICSAYLVFIASTVRTLMVPPLMQSAPSQNFLVVCITPLFIALALLRNMAGLSFISLLGNAAVVLGMSCVGLHAFTHTTPALANIPAWEMSKLAAAYGSIAFLFFVHFTLMPIEDAMADRGAFMTSAVKGFSFCAAISAVFGLMGAAAFGTGVNSVVITHLEGTILSVIVKLLLCANLLFTVPIAARGAFGIIEGFFPGLKQGTLNLIRVAFICSAALVATCIPSFGSLLGLVGGVSLSALTLVFPPLMLLKTAKEGEVSALEKAVSLFLAVFGCVVMVLNIIFRS